MGGPAEDDAEAPTLAQGVTPGTPTAFAGRESRPEISSLGPGAMIGRYCLARRIGAGAMGVVWSAHDPQLDRSIAIKLVHPSLARSDEAAGRLLREARAMAKLSHRSVIMVHDAGNVDGQLFIAMELIDGTNLGTILRARSEHQVLDGTKARNNYMVGQLRDGVWQLLMQTDDDILSFVRPSPDGNQVLVLARVYAPEVWQIQLAQP